MAAAPVLPASPASTPEPARLSEGARIVNTFIAPSKTFTDLRRSASWWAPWLLIAIFSLLFVYSMGRQIGFDQISRNQIAHSSRAEQFDKLPPDQQARQIRISTAFIRYFAYGSPVLILFFTLVSTVVLWATFKIAAGAETTFGQAYAISMYAALPGIIGAILGTVALFAGVDPEGFDVNNPVGTNVAYYLDAASTGKFLRAMASALDVITIWSIVLIGIGYASTSKVKRSTAIWIVVGWYLVWKVLTSGLAAAFS
jgi:Yip1-like protein